MDYKIRLKQLEQKQETVGLDDKDIQELALIHTICLQAAKENMELLIAELKRERALRK